ncbi:arginine N-methyltransferase type I (PRMT6) [Leptomonas pyrrhocoris]|uniref:Arginine N-methyltransferase type I (PRMT6) n=1 Tax=Leptomonas pyrrhocoris TaxID=157538 RepID=A0A0N0VE96_LEPPY|nr:arginine N-methyltransferase type I (PRMT6) [Leptomonas pyrrhocoris]XP_015656191.1 arginine N-methyltransferase type I (PRMT6) [Leptomonas pyrrhocoris]XP_015656192.1 arginine N-methyltransferase type I (PRMT6) [Leptomonas pyrrhocoris]XP_015656193.1 arginine N-methyltransferase type I (PRMT6) [Leptomonas pyrrhocoris]KPA77751.1 arginine N-methyltransferase type I (PRMT6) [Leptomonas pyrrhocoris]KPA77752.1 arginine N-methyltransferase type I (PRMT6) [Leptomonas pyrrhocoris]KPA77753.1 arginine|eukprot:XP_015656190.1 arginine N-methyltransferase type I (PRMT6) [Leptomonas pyrrhocoris]
MQHQEDYASDASKDEQYFEGYADLGVHKVMLKDRPRMDFYKGILTDKNIVEGKLVVDVGSGSGILSCWAAQSGAAHVLSIEASSMSDIQQQIVHDNNLADKVTVVASTVEDLIRAGTDAFLDTYPAVRQAGGISLVVSEWMGFYLFHECMLPSVLRARDFFKEVNTALNANVDVQMIPSHGQLHAAPISLRQYYEESFASFWANVDGVRLETLGKLEFEQHLESASPLVEVLPLRCLLHEGEVFWEGCFDTLHVDELEEVKAARTFHFTNSAFARRRLQEAGNLVLDGFTIWFEVSFGKLVLDTAPTAPPTHWKQTTVLLPREVREGEVVAFDNADEDLELTLCLTAQDLSQRYYKIEFELN